MDKSNQMSSDKQRSSNLRMLLKSGGTPPHSKTWPPWHAHPAPAGRFAFWSAPLLRRFSMTRNVIKAGSHAQLRSLFFRAQSHKKRVLLWAKFVASCEDFCRQRTDPPNTPNDAKDERLEISRLRRVAFALTMACMGY